MTAMHANLARRTARGLALVGLVLCASPSLVLPAAPASAHAVLLRLHPARRRASCRGARRGRPDVQRVGPAGARQDPGDRAGRQARRRGRADGRPAATVTVTLRPGGPRGTYLVSYRVISADSHPVAGGFTYSVGAPSAATGPTLAAPTTRSTRSCGWRSRSPSTSGTPGWCCWSARCWCWRCCGRSRLSRRGPARLVWTGLGLVGAEHRGRAAAPGPVHHRHGAERRHRRRPAAGARQPVRHRAPGPARRAGRRGAAAACRCCAAASGTADRVLLAVLGVVADRHLAAGRAPGRLAGARPSPSSSTRSTWPAWPCGWAAWSCSSASCCARPTSASWGRSCRSGRAGPRWPWPRWCWPASPRR